MADLSDAYLHCSKCGKRVSSIPFIRNDYVVRAFVECPECIETSATDTDDQAARVPALEARVAELEGALQTIADPTTFALPPGIVASLALSGSSPLPAAPVPAATMRELAAAFWDVVNTHTRKASKRFDAALARVREIKENDDAVPEVR
jgi:hypothetical protein